MTVAVQNGPHIILSGEPFLNKKTSFIESRMEYYEYCLAEWMASSWKDRKLARITIQTRPFYNMLLTLEALSFIPGQGIIYRLLLPQFIGYNTDDHFVLTDFSHAMYSDNRTRNPSMPIASGFMAPEMFQKQDPTTAVDIWAVGVLFLELLLLLPVNKMLSQSSESKARGSSQHTFQSNEKRDSRARSQISGSLQTNS
ncbi:hypothetical protein EPUS_01175 [Endocarpon pusillum Z07020]|uniref:Protein kinase domain-containing protein n=1 Tax=Endocarpon pusillum (strain Z07020 / HMAS-L-300199) TaxID=1263415 RepID=U1GB29_ENDPU|nr:uncharacterized protein EPUS_01175 [Endocarpon pusillum Z07020]ERF69218.1 hypothetical protein EPUS_01175 [Endocarpon pusillum Z07020]